MEENERCKGIVKTTGKKCKYEGLLWGYCTMHYQQRHREKEKKKEVR